MGTGSSRPGSKAVTTLKTLQQIQRHHIISKNSSIMATNKPDDTSNVSQLENGVSTMNVHGVHDKETTAVTPKFNDIKSDLQSTEVPGEAEKGLVEKKSTIKVLTEEEKETNYNEALTKALGKMEKLATVAIRDEDEEGQPYTKDFRQCILVICMSYFALKRDQYDYEFILKFRKELIVGLLKHNSAQIIVDAMPEAIKRRDFVTEDGKMINDFWFPLKNIVLSLLNFSDCSIELRHIIADHPEALKLNAQLIKEWTTPHLKEELTENQNKLVKWMVSIFHNCGMTEELVPRLRELDIIKLLLPFLDSPMDVIRLSTIATLADLVNEEESELLRAHVSIFQFILKKLKGALKNSDHKHVGWSLTELLRAVRQLARNDANKKILVNEGCLPILLRVLDEGNEEEKQAAVDAMWILSFDEENKNKMLDLDGLICKIHDIYLHSTNKGEKHSCHGILWSLRSNLTTSEKFKAIGEEICHVESGAKLKETPVSSPEEITAEEDSGIEFKGHVMMSYQWGHQELVLKITKELRSHGIPVWIDVDYMGGSTLQAMAKAVEDSFVVVIAMTQKYKDSPNTRAEAEYAFQQRKKIIPLILQKGYRPDGWLGLILGSKLFYDFSGKYSFESRLDGLLKAIQFSARGFDVTDGNIAEQPMIEATPAPVVSSRPQPVSHGQPIVVTVDEEKVKNWTVDEKKRWLTKHKLEKSALLQLSGEELIFLSNLRSEAPEFFYRCLETKLALSSLLDLSRATKALSDLTL